MSRRLLPIWSSGAFVFAVAFTLGIMASSARTWPEELGTIAVAADSTDYGAAEHYAKLNLVRSANAVLVACQQERCVRDYRRWIGIEAANAESWISAQNNVKLAAQEHKVVGEMQVVSDALGLAR